MAQAAKRASSTRMPIALALLATDEQIGRAALHDYVLCGELALDGTLRAVPGVLAMALAAKQAGFTRIVVPAANRDEAALVEGLDVYAVPALADAIAVVLGHGAKFRRRGATVLEEAERADVGDFLRRQGPTARQARAQDRRGGWTQPSSWSARRAAARPCSRGGGLARSRSRRTACSISTSWASFRARCSKCCASRWKRAR